VSGQRLANPCQLALGVRSSHDALCAQAGKADVVMVRHKEGVLRRGLETLHTTPGHVLNSHESTVVQKNEVEFTVSDDGAVERIDDLGDDFPRRLGRGIGVKNAAAALGPFLDRRIDSFLDIGAVEVDLLAFGQVVERAGEAENIPEKRAGSRNLVDVEAWVAEENVVVDLVVHVATLDLRVVGGLRELADRWEGEVLVHVVGVTAAVGGLVDVLSEGLVEVEKPSPLVDECYRRNVLKQNILGDTGVVEHHTLRVVVGGVVLVNHGVGDVGHVASSIRFSSDVDLAVLQTESLDKVLEEAKKLRGGLLLAGSGGVTLGETCADRWPKDKCTKSVFVSHTFWTWDYAYSTQTMFVKFAQFHGL
jgi:hypothetical protein